MKIQINKSITPVNENIRLFKIKGINYLQKLDEQRLNEILKEANQKYYLENINLLSDDQYDIIRDYVKKVYPNNVVAKNAHKHVAIKKGKIKLPYFMGSMDKIKPDTNELEKYIKKFKGPFELSTKEDGASVLYSTEGGIQKLYSRGNGTYGHDISRLIPFLNVPTDENLTFRGELNIKKEIFEKKYKEKFSKPRSFCSGMIIKAQSNKDLDPEKLKDLDIVFYEVIRPILKPSDQMKFILDHGCLCVKHKLLPEISNEILSEQLIKWREDYHYTIDGIIVSDDKIYKRKNGNPIHSFAFKMILTDQIAEGKVIAVLWDPSKDGYLKPRIQIEPVMLGGSKIQFITGYNAKYIKDNGIGIGSVIEFIISGDIIPKLLKNTKVEPSLPSDEFDFEWNDTGVDLILKNKDQNSIVQEKNISGFFKILEVPGLSDGNIKKLIKQGYNSVQKIVKMSIDDFLKIDGIQSKLAIKFKNGIDEKLKLSSLPLLMKASNLFGRGFGERKCKLILSKYPNILTSSENNEQKFIKINAIDGMADKTSRKFIEGIKPFVDFMNDLDLNYKLVYKSDTLKPKKDHELFDKKYVMTGFRDKEIIKKLEILGAIQSSSVNKNTFIVIVNNLDLDNNKTQKAKLLNIPIIEISDFKKKYHL